MYILSDDIRIGQALTMFVTSTVFLFNMPFYFIGGSILLPTMSLLILFFFNWMAARMHYIYIQEGKIHISSLYASKKILEGDLFSKIKEESFPGYFYYRLYLKNGNKYTFSKNNFVDVLTTLRRGREGMIDKMIQEVKKELSIGETIKINKSKIKSRA
jgi:energy-coupling factor transporter transmembrane protein EcfT